MEVNNNAELGIEVAVWKSFSHLHNSYYGTFEKALIKVTVFDSLVTLSFYLLFALSFFRGEGGVGVPKLLELL